MYASIALVSSLWLAVMGMFWTPAGPTREENSLKLGGDIWMQLHQGICNCRAQVRSSRLTATPQSTKAWILSWFAGSVDQDSVTRRLYWVAVGIKGVLLTRRSRSPGELGHFRPMRDESVTAAQETWWWKDSKFQIECCLRKGETRSKWNQLGLWEKQKRRIIIRVPRLIIRGDFDSQEKGYWRLGCDTRLWCWFTLIIQKCFQRLFMRHMKS